MLDRTMPPVIRLLTSGGDERIALDPLTGFNRYLCAPAPDAGIAFASSTANALSPSAFGHVAALADRIIDRGFGSQDYALALESFRIRIGAAYGLDAGCRIVFAPSGTDLEYVALAAGAGQGERITNILLAPEEVGSGCIRSAAGQHFAASTARGVPTRTGATVDGLDEVTIVALPIRGPDGIELPSALIAERISHTATQALCEGRRPLAHIVHGSKTGLIAPDMADLDRLRETFGDRLRFVVDACQARISAETIRAYLARNIVILLSGSKFIGGAPFSGFALVPDVRARGAAPLPSGFGAIFSRAEWPGSWPGRNLLPDAANAGLYLRLASALHELERFGRIPHWRVERVLAAFQSAVVSLADRLGARLLAPKLPGSGLRSLATMDLSAIDPQLDHEAAQIVHRDMVARGVRLGQPVRCLPLAGSGRDAGTVRLALSMPQVTAYNALCDRALLRTLTEDMDAIRAALAGAVAAWRTGGLAGTARVG